MKLLLTILITLSLKSYSQNRVFSFESEITLVKITKIKVQDSVTRVWMKDKLRKRYYTECLCVVPYKKKDIIYIKRPK